MGHTPDKKVVDWEEMAQEEGQAEDTAKEVSAEGEEVTGDEDFGDLFDDLDMPDLDEEGNPCEGCDGCSCSDEAGEEEAE